MKTFLRRKCKMKEKPYTIKIPHFYCLEYYEQDRCMIVDIDFRDPVMYLGPECIRKWQPPYENIEVSLEDKARILSNVYNALIDRGFRNIEFTNAIR